MHILGAIAEFERGRIVERVKAGLARARAAGTRLGRRRSRAVRDFGRLRRAVSRRRSRTARGGRRIRQAVAARRPAARVRIPSHCVLTFALFSQPRASFAGRGQDHLI
jgi:DNA invertase Pin-like site-specific DNA recombinase